MNDQYINDPGTTLAAAITSSGATTLSVVSSSGYGTGTVEFRILIDSELMMVTNISGTTWTVTRGIESTVAATHSLGSAVNAVVTVASLLQLLQLANTVGTYSSLPAAAANGARYVTTDSIYEFVGVAAAWKAFYKGIAVTVPPSGSWTWDVQGGSTNANTKGALQIGFAPGATNLRMYYRTAPAAPYVLTVRMRVLPWSGVGTGSNSGYGIGFRDSSGKIVSFILFTQTGNRGLETDKWTDANTYSAGYNSTLSNNIGVGLAALVTGQDLVMRISDDNTNLTFEFSFDDGITWIQYDQRARTNFFASGPTQIGVIQVSQAGAEGATVTVVDWSIE